jgi:diketogulonate reductase-like aldo/keto reductase
MRYEHIHNLTIPKIGFGTWTIGGRTSADPGSDEVSRQALRYALASGYKHFDTAEVYAAGHSEELLGELIRDMDIPRETLFITSKVSPENLHFADVLRSCGNSLRRLGMDYLDLYLIHWPANGIPLPETFKALNHLVHDGKVRALGVSNFNLKLLKQSVELCETPLLTNQVPYSVADRSYEENGVLSFCQENDILLTAYSPVKPHSIISNPVVKDIAKTRGITSQQIALAWLVTQPRVITIPMSTNGRHQVENLQAADIVLSAEEMSRLG